MAAKVAPGMKFGRLTVLDRFGASPNGSTLWRCLCECGNEKRATTSHLTGGYIQSCGCLKRDSGRTVCEKRNTTHGDSKHGRYKRLYSVWRNMRDRCLNPQCHAYKDYGGRGIQICAEWSDYQKFKDWAIAAGYDPAAPYGQCTLDRIDCDKGYSPDNCRWVGMKVQADNRRSGRSPDGRYTKAKGE